MKITIITFSLLYILLNMPSYAGKYTDIKTPKSKKNQYVVIYKDSLKNKRLSSLDVKQDLMVQHRATVKKEFSSFINGAVVSMSESDAKQLALNPDVLAVEHDVSFKLDYEQSNAPWGLDRIDQPNLGLNQIYRYNDKAGQGVHVYVVDSGIDQNHPSFESRFGNQTDTTHLIGDDDNIYFDPDSNCPSHGTHVAGIIGSKDWGVAKKVTLHSVRVMDCSSGTLSSVIAGLDWIYNNVQTPAVINMSIGAPLTTDYNGIALHQVISGLVSEKKVTIVASAGNNNVSACEQSPGNRSDVITVAASSKFDNRSSYSNFGTCVNIFAPGDDIVSTATGSSSMTMSGTSQAAPHVAGAAALYLAVNPNATPASVKSALLSNASNTINHAEGTDGLLNVSFLGGSAGQEPLPPTKPANVSATSMRCFGQNNLTWNSVSGANYYEVYNSNYSSFTSGNFYRATVNTNTMVNVSRRSNYVYFKVKACNDIGCSDVSSSYGRATFTSSCQ